MAAWIAAAGLPRALIYNHQTPGIDPERWGDAPSTAVLSGGATVGVTTYGAHARDTVLLARYRGMGRNFGIFEWNPAISGDNGYDVVYRALVGAYRNTTRVVAPYAWPTEPNFPSLSIKGQPAERVLRDFIAAQGQTDR